MQTAKIQENSEQKSESANLTKVSSLLIDELAVFTSILFHDIPCWRLKEISLTNNSQLLISVDSTQETSLCPLCHSPSGKKQSHYNRYPQELPLGNYSCRLALRVHRFYCLNPECRRKIFCERFEDHLRSYQRCVDKVNEQILFIGLEAGGSKGARLLNKSHIQIKRNSVIRRILALPLSHHSLVENIGIDDWSKRKGHEYGSIIIDNDTHKPVDLLAHRESGCVCEALKGYTNLKTVTSDRADCFSKAIREACPEAKEIADRWHLSHNLSDAVQRAFRGHYNGIMDALSTCQVKKKKQAGSLVTGKTTLRQEKFIRIKELQKRGCTKSEVVRLTGITHNTVNKYWNQTEFKQVQYKKRSGIEEYDGYLKMRFHDEQVQSSVSLFKEIKEMGYTGSRETVNLYIRSWRPSLKPKVKIPKWKTLYYLCKKEESKCSEQERLWLKVVYRSKEMKELLDAQKEFNQALKSRDVKLLEEWLKTETTCLELKQFINGIIQDYDAVVNAFREKWHNGTTEGFVNKLKMIKRMCYGRGSIELLKRMMICV